MASRKKKLEGCALRGAHGGKVYLLLTSRSCAYGPSVGESTLEIWKRNEAFDEEIHRKEARPHAATLGRVPHPMRPRPHGRSLVPRLLFLCCFSFCKMTPRPARCARSHGRTLNTTSRNPRTGSP